MLRKTLLLVAVIGIAAAVTAANVETVSRVFRLEYASVSEASAAIQPMLSEVGSLTLQPGLSRIVVQDQPEIIDRVTELIEKLDHVPETYRVQVDLLEGGAEDPFGSALEVEVDNRLRRMFKVAAFRRLGTSVIEGQVGNRAQADLGTTYRISLLANLPLPPKTSAWGAPDPGNRIYLRPLVLERMSTLPNGTLKAHELLRTNVLLSQNQTVYIGAGNSEDSERVLVLIVSAKETGGR